MPAGVFTTPRPIPGRLVPGLASGTVLVVALPVFLVTGWRLAGWTLGFVLWAGSQVFGLVLARIRATTGNAAAGVLAFGMMFRAVGVMVVLVAVAASDAKLALAGALVYALAYTTELALSLIAYFEAPAR